MKTLEQLKEEFILKTEEHTGIKQDGMRKKFEQIASFDDLRKQCEEDIEYWNGEGSMWSHNFYFGFARIARNIKDQISN